MSQLAWMAFLIAVLLGFGFFVFAKRDFDFLTISYIGGVFYFAPLFWGGVLQPSPELSSTVQPAVYLIASAYVLGLVLAGILWRRFERDDVPVDRPAHPLAGYYAILALFGLVGSLISTHGAIINADKVETLKQVGYFYALFEVAASLSCVSAVVERRWWMAAGGAFLLLIDLLVGFRPFVVLSSLGVALVLLMREGRIRLYLKTPTYGVATIGLVAAMLLVHSVRFAIFDKIAELEGVPSAERVTKTSEMRSDMIQFSQFAENGSRMPNWASMPLKLFEQSEPFVIQATLVAVVQTNLSCSASNIFKSLSLLLPPGMAKFMPGNSFPPTFYDEYQPVLYPDLTYGTGGNIWAEMLCRFGYPGVAIFGLLLILTLIGLNRLLLKSSAALVAPIAFGGAVVAFYIYRNDLHYTLVMLRQTAIVFVVAYGLSVISVKIHPAMGGRPGAAALDDEPVA
jgi:hypothetical protein